MMPAVEFAIETGPGHSLQLQVQAAGRIIALPIDAGQAAQLGRALLAASVLCDPRCPPPPPGSTITTCRLPAIGWRVGAIEHGSRPVLDLRLVSGAELSILLTPRSALACGEQLQMTAKLALASEAEVQSEIPATP
jgi:hypothetical protein